MSPKAFLIWSIVTAATVLAAALASLGQPQVAEVRVDGEPAFPDLHRSTDTVARIIVETPEIQLTIERGEDGWGVVERSGYPASQETLRRLIVGLADLRLAEAKTALPERHARLEVENPAAEGARSRQVRLEGADGAVLAAAVIGRQTGYTAGREAGTYIRRPGENQAWLASGAVQVPGTAADWLDREVLSLPVGDLTRVEVAPAEGEPYAIVRDPGSEDFRLENPPEDRKVKDRSLGRVAGGVARIELIDVEPRDGFDRDGAHHAAAFTLEGGLEVRATLIEDGEDRWLLLDTRSADAEAAKQAEEIAAKTADWAYKIDKRTFERMTVPLEDHLEAKDETS